MAKKKSLKKYQDTSQVSDSTNVDPRNQVRLMQEMQNALRGIHTSRYRPDSSNIDIINKEKLQELLPLIEAQRDSIRQRIRPMIPSSIRKERKGGSIKKKK